MKGISNTLIEDKKSKKKINLIKISRYGIQTGFIGLAFSVALSRSGIGIFSGLILLSWIIEGDFRDKWMQLKNNRLFHSIVIYLSFQLLSLIWTENFYSVIPNFKDSLYLLLIPLFITSFKPNYLKIIFYCTAAGIFIDIIGSYLIFFKIVSIKGKVSEDPVMIMNHLDYNIILAVFALYMLNHLVNRKIINMRNIFVFCIFLACLCLIFIVDGRSGQLGFIAGFFFITIYYSKKWLKIGIPVISGILLLIVLAVLYKTDHGFRKQIFSTSEEFIKASENNYDSSIGIRIIAGRVTFDIFKNHWLLGVGIGDLQHEIWKMLRTDKYKDLDSKNPLELGPFLLSWTHLHNQYFQTLVQTGLIGLFLLFNMFFQFIRNLPKEPQFRAMGYLVTIVYMVGFMAEPFLRKQFPVVLLCLIFALLNYIKQIEKSNPANFLENFDSK